MAALHGDLKALASPTAAPPAAASELHVQLDAELPDELAVGRGTAVFVCGWCYCPVAAVRTLELLVDGTPQGLTAFGMPRLDLFRSLHPALDPYATGHLAADPDSPDDPSLHSYASGFWGMAQIDAAARDTCLLALRATLDGGGQATTELGRVALVPPSPPLPDAGAPVAICMATHNPPEDLLEIQLRSITEQTHRDWVCIISDDCSSPERFAALQRAVADDPRFILTRAPRRLGFYRNFERALTLVPADAAFVALSDQDDSWHPDKLATLLETLGDAQLVYSDARIVSRDGQPIADTYWGTRRNEHSDLQSLLVANAVTGAASLFRRELLEDALPFPPAQFAHFHDHWLGLTALALGDIAFVDRPLYDYVQHGGAELGHAAATSMPTLSDRWTTLRRDPRGRIRMWRMHYFVDVCRLEQFATVLQMRCGDRMSAAKRRSLERFLRADRSPAALAALALRGARELARRRPATLGAEWMLFRALGWRRMLAASARERPQRRARLDALPPPTLAQKPGRGGLEGTAPHAIAHKIAPLHLAIADDAPERINLLLPTIDLDHFFGGYIAKLNLARRLAEHGRRVRLVTVDPVGTLPRDWRRRLEAYSGLAGLFDRVEVAFGRESNGLEVSRTDRFIATTWWTAHIAARARQALGEERRFLYLIQEYEPFTFPMGSYAALASESYRFEHHALFSTELLRAFFAAHGLGVYAGRGGEALTFQNAITAVPPPSAAELSARSARRLLVYARPEPHAARNMFELAILALYRALEEGTFQSGWELHGIGGLGPERRVALGGGVTLELLPRVDQASYASVLREHDVGLALMYTPHPSLVPIEMASAGMLTVTNSFENKTAAALSAISPNLITAEPTIEGIADGLRAAALGVEDHAGRAHGSHVAWSRDWDESFDDALTGRIIELLQA